MEEVLILVTVIGIVRLVFVVFKTPEPHQDKTLDPEQSAMDVERKEQDITWKEFLFSGEY